MDLPRDLEFAAKAGLVLDLYEGVFAGCALGAGEFVISADEKTSIQARCRCHPTLPPGRARAMRVEHEYERRGALAYLAAWDVYHARLFGRCEASTGIEPFGRLVAQVMTLCLASRPATSRPQRRSTGASPAPTWTGSCAAWTKQSSSPRPHDHHAASSGRG